jgi:hypothetical protein
MRLPLQAGKEKSSKAVEGREKDRSVKCIESVQLRPPERGGRAGYLNQEERLSLAIFVSLAKVC